MLWIKLLKKIIKVLNSDVSPRQLAGGIALGSIIGITPFASLHNLLIFFIIMIVKVNFGAAMLGIAIFSMIGLALDPFSNVIGYYLLVKLSALTPFWTTLYNLPVVPFTRFNNTLVLGSLVISIFAFIPVFYLSNKFIVVYRERFMAKVANSKFMKVFRLTSIYKIYNKFSFGE